MAGGYLARWTTTGYAGYREKAVQCLRWLDENKSPGYAAHSWGNHFDFVSRVGRLPRNEPIIVWTSLIGQVFLDAFELTGDPSYLEIARSICKWILALPRERTRMGTCLSYVAFTQRSIHNSNMLGAAMLARTAKHTADPDLMTVAREAMEYSCSRQKANGAWTYAENPNSQWIDNFHTGYNLDSLKCYQRYSGDMSFEDHLKRGWTFFKESFFEASGRPKYYHDRAFPIDSQCASQSIETLATFSDDDPTALALAARVANWTIDNMQDRKGYFYYRQYPWLKAKAPMLHWAQATTYRALAVLVARLTAARGLQTGKAPRTS